MPAVISKRRARSNAIQWIYLVERGEKTGKTITNH